MALKPWVFRVRVQETCARSTAKGRRMPPDCQELLTPGLPPSSPQPTHQALNSSVSSLTHVSTSCCV